MKRRTFLQALALSTTTPFLIKADLTNTMKKTRIRLLRHATLLIQMADKTILIDPMLSARNAMDPVGNAGNSIRIPMVDLPIDGKEMESIVALADAVMVTHLHRDHWDIAAQQMIDKNKIIFCQPGDESKLKEQGFETTMPVSDRLVWGDITITRTGGKHGTGEIGKLMGEVSGFILDDSQRKIYIAGDTIWCDDVKATLAQHQPDVTILNAGGAQFLQGDPITMTPDDVLKVHQQLPSTEIIAVHMDTVNHCFIKRSDLAIAMKSQKIESKVQLPKDGEIVEVA